MTVVLGQKKDRHLVLDPVEAIRVHRIYSDVAEGVPIRQIVLALERDGQQTSLGGTEWWPASIHRMVKNEIYKGVWRGLKSKTRREKVNGQIKRVTRPRPESEQGPIFPCPRIVSDALWEQANARLALNKLASLRNNSTPETHLVRAFGFCGECGWSLQAIPANRGRKARYGCGNTLKGACPCPSILQERLDAEVWERVALVAYSPSQGLKKMIEQVTDGTLGGRITELEATEASLDKKAKGLLKGIAKAYAGGDDSLATGLEADWQPLNQAGLGARAELVSLKEQARRQEDLQDLPSRLEAIVRGQDGAFHDLSFKAKQNLLTKLAVKAELGTGLPDSKLKHQTRITMQLTPDMYWGLDEDGEGDVDPENLVGEALNVLVVKRDAGDSCRGRRRSPGRSPPRRDRGR